MPARDRATCVWIQSTAHTNAPTGICAKRTFDRAPQIRVVGLHGRSARVIRVQVLKGESVYVLRDLNVVSVIANILGIENPATPKLSLNSQRPPCLFGNPRILVEEADVLTKRGLSTKAVASWFDDGGVRKCRREQHRQRPTVRTGRQGHSGRLRVAALNYIAAALTEKSLVQTKAATEHGLIVPLISNARSRQKTILRSVVKSPACVLGRKQKTALGIYIR